MTPNQIKKDLEKYYFQGLKDNKVTGLLIANEAFKKIDEIFAYFERKLMKNIEIITMDRKLIKTIPFDTLTEMEEYFDSYIIGDKLLVKNQWLRVIAKGDFVFFVKGE